MAVAHAVLKPSAAGCWVHCSGSVAMQAAHPDTDSEHSANGRAAHFSGELQIQGVAETVGLQDADGTVIDQEMHDAATVYAEEVRTVAPLDKLVIEQQIKIPRVHELCAGTPDVYAYEPITKTLYIWDFKFGFGEVDPFENWQGICYTAGILDKLKLNDQETTVRLRIIQPRAFHPDGPVREWMFKASDIRGHINQLEAAAIAAVGPDPQLVSGEHCRYCTGRHACPALRGSAYYACDLSEKFAIDDMSPAALGLQYRLLKAAADRLAYRLTGVQTQIEGLIKRGEVGTGFTLEGKVGALSWDQSREAVAGLGDLLGVELRKDPDVCTPTQAIKKGIDAEVIKAYASRKTSGAKLVPSDQTLASRVFTKGV